MLDKRKFYINGTWVDPIKKNDFDVINPCNEDPFAVISLGSKEDTDLAVKSCLLYTSPSPRDATLSRMPSSA